jgi:hypothetical protein
MVQSYTPYFKSTKKMRFTKSSPQIINATTMLNLKTWINLVPSTLRLKLKTWINLVPSSNLTSSAILYTYIFMTYYKSFFWHHSPIIKITLHHLYLAIWTGLNRSARSTIKLVWHDHDPTWKIARRATPRSASGRAQASPLARHARHDTTRLAGFVHHRIQSCALLRACPSTTISTATAPSCASILTPAPQ